MPRPTSPPHRDADAPGGSLGVAVLDAAHRRFLDGGIDALSVRAIATDAGCTTMAVYTHFGGKDGLIQHFFDEGFARLADAQRAVPETLPLHERVVALCLSYRRIAHAYPHHYDLMLGAHSGRFQPAPESRARALATIEYLTDVLAPLEAAGPMQRERAAERARAVIAFCHGWVMLERAGLHPLNDKSDAAFERSVHTLLHVTPAD
jgi:AcrR family transcriptional regulator